MVTQEYESKLQPYDDNPPSKGRNSSTISELEDINPLTSKGVPYKHNFRSSSQGNNTTKHPFPISLHKPFGSYWLK